MLSALSSWISPYVPQQHLAMTVMLLGLLAILCVCILGFYIAKHYILVVIERLIKRSKNTWDDFLHQHHVFSRIAMLTPMVLLFLLAPLFTKTPSVLQDVVITLAKIAVTFQIARIIDAILNVIKSAGEEHAKERYLPLNASIQVVKLLVYLVATILAVSFIIDRSPIYLLSGLGALTAVLLLVFQDTIKGLVASIQISANKMVAPGDWIEIPQYGADGDVLEIGLNTVKVRNFDNTVTTVPTYALISGSFKNWRDMFQSGGRRIKRTITVDVSSIRFYQADDIAKLRKIVLLEDYLSMKQQELDEHNAKFSETVRELNQRQLTNVGTFRAYVTAYLQQHPKVHPDMTCMVRQLPSTGSGLPLELYFFSNDQKWVNYEGIQADIFDHLYAMAPIFDIRLFQHPTGSDWRAYRNHQ
ncbi:mechanosensitive ion channel family protein [Thalassotalea fusca]